MLFHQTLRRVRCKALLLPLLLCWSVQPLFSQLRINDTCPDLRFEVVDGQKVRETSLSEIGHKAVIIEFWDTRCLSCLQSFQRLDSLAKKFENQVQFLLVTKESKAIVDAFFAGHKKVRRPDVPLVTGDRCFSTLFPADGYPYTVWLDAARIVRYLTAGYNTTVHHLEQFLSGRLPTLSYTAVKTRYSPLWTLTDSLLVNNVVFYSGITKCVNGLDIGIPDGMLLNEGRSVSLSCNCCTLSELLKKAFGEQEHYPVHTRYGIAFELKDSLQLRAPADEDLLDLWRQRYLYNYQAVVPVERKHLLYKVMQSDLLKVFPISAERIEKGVDGYELVCDPNSELKESNGGTPLDAYMDAGGTDGEVLHFRNQPVGRLYELLGIWLQYWYPLATSVPLVGRVDFSIRKSSVNPINIEQLREDLKAIHLDLQPVKIVVPVLRVREK